MTDAGWAERKAARKWKTPELQRIYAAALKAEHARSVHIVKAEFKRVKLDDYSHTEETRKMILYSLNKLLTALQRGRGKGGVK